MNSNWTLMNYRELKKQIKNAVSELGTVLELKGVVADTSKLPLTGNKKGDVYIVSEDNTEYVWTSDNASGLITDYEELGPVISGSFLPPVTETDAGKVATVVDGEWTAGNSVYIIECDGNNSPLTASEIRAIAQSGMYPVLHYYTAYWLYALNDINNAYFTKLLYGSPSDQKFYVNVAFVNSNKGVNQLLDKKVYTIDSTGIPESDLAQAVRDKLTRGNSNIMQVIPVEYDGSNFTVHLMPMDIDDGYTLTYEQEGETRSATFPAFRDSSYTQIMLYLTGSQWTEGMMFAVTPDYSNVDGVIFHTQIVALDGIGLTGYVGVLTINPDNGNNANYTATIHYWQADTPSANGVSF